MPIIDPVVLQLKADVADYKRDLTSAERLSAEKLDRIGRAGTATGVAMRKGFDLAKGAAVAFAASISVGTIVNAIQKGLDYASALGEQAKALGISTDAFQEYSYAATQVGLSQSELETGIIRLTRAIGEAADDTDGPAAKAFQKLGVNIRDANGEVRNAADIIPDIAKGYAGLGSDAERSAAGFDLLGRGASKFATLLEGGSKGVNELRNAAHELGIVLSSEQIQKADDAADKLEAVKKVLEAKIAGVVADNADSIVRLADSLSSLADRAIKAYDALQKLSKTPLGRFFDKANAALSYTSPAGIAVKAIQRGLDLTENPRTGGAPARPARAAPRPQTRAAPLPGLQPYTFNAAPQSDNPFGNPGAGPGIIALLGADPVASGKIITAIDAALTQLEADIATARAELSGNLQEQAEARKQQIDASLAADVEQVRADGDKSKAQQDELIKRKTLIASLEKQAVDAQLAEDVARETADAAQRERDAKEVNTRLAIDALSAEADLADTRTARLAIERRILELRQEEERNQLEQQITDGKILDAKQARADLERRQSAERGGLERDFEGPLARYGRDAKDTKTRIEEAAARRIDELNDTIADTMAKKLGVKDPFLKELLKIFLDQNIFGPLAEALSGQGGGGGILGGIVAGLGAIFGGGRASGGRVNAGTMYRINEGASPGRVEGFIPQGSGEIVPLGRMNAMRGGGQGGGTVRIIVEEGPNFMSTIRAEAVGVAIEVHKATLPGTVNAAASETIRRVGRPRL